MTKKTTEPLSPIRQLEEQIWGTAPTDADLTFPGGDNLEGLKYLKPGFAISPAYDRAFALGFPFCSCASPKSLSNGDATLIARGYAFNSWRGPSEVVRKLARLTAVQGMKFTPSPGVIEILPHAEELLESDAPLTVAELEEALRKIYQAPGWMSEIHRLALMTEPDLGPERVARVLSTAIRNASTEIAAGDEIARDSLAHSLGFILLRCSENVVGELTSQLEDWLSENEHLLPGAKSAPRTRAERRSLWRNVDILIGGAKRARRSGQRNGDVLFGSDALFIHDEPNLVAACYLADEPPTVQVSDARFAFLAGDGLLEAIMPRLNKLKVAERPKYMETFGLIKSPLIVEWLKKNKKLPIAKQLLKLHGV